MRRGLLIVTLLVAVTTTAWSATEPEILDLRTKVVDLVFTVEDLDAVARDVEGSGRDLDVTETSTEIRIELAADVLFDFNKADLRPSAQAALKRAAAVIRDRAKGEVLIEGHTDSIGSDAYNQRLSERRADAVKRWLTEVERLDGSGLVVRGYGATRPVAPNTKHDGADDPEGRQKNRRVEITVKKRA
jgi:outer membrane protein OmpA-like peptidoglycan-associated protein